jgi:hypothetical protein
MEVLPGSDILFDQATGVLMGHFRCDETTATDLLRHAAAGTSEREMARRLIHVNERPAVLQWIAGLGRAT